MSVPTGNPSRSSTHQDRATDFEKRRQAFEREPSNIQLLSTPGMTFGATSQRGVASGRGQEPTRASRPQRHDEATGSDLAIGEETGQKEQVFHAPPRSNPPTDQTHSDRRRRTASQTRVVSPPLLPPEDTEREDPVLSQQIAVLRLQNEQLQQQLREREAEKERLTKQLEDRNVRSNYSPIGLPSRVLDGRKVLRDSLPSSTTPPPRPLTPTSPLPPSPRLPNSPLPYGMEVKGELFQLSELRRINQHLEQRMADVVEEKRRLEVELHRHKHTLEKVQDREQDLTQDIETLRTENSHHTGAISKLKAERDNLKSSNSLFKSQVNSLTNTLTKTEKCYKEVEQENLTLQADLKQLLVDKEQLSSELLKLQSTVEDALKTKENYRSTIRQLREQNVSLEGQLSGTEHAQNKAGEVKVHQQSPVTKGQQVLSEVLTLRHEKSQLKGRLKDAQEEIDSLEATLKDHEARDDVENREVLTAHLEGFREQVLSISQDLRAAKKTVAMLTTEQQSMTHDSFVLLADKCRQELQQAAEDKGQLAEALANAESSLVSLQGDYEKLCNENHRLTSQKSSVSSEVSNLRSEIQNLLDQKKLLEVQLSQTNILTQQREDEIQTLAAEKSKLEERFKTSEKLWRSERGRLEQEWEGKVAMATQAHELLLDSKEALESEKVELERKLCELEHENQQLGLEHSEYQKRIQELETQVSTLTSRVVDTERAIESAQKGIASLVAEKALLGAKARVVGEMLESKLAQFKDHQSGELEDLKSENESLVRELELERDAVSVKLVEKDSQLNTLTTKVSVLVNEKEHLETEMKLLTDKHAKAQQDVQLLAEKEERRHLDNEKLRMTLTTEIELLKSKLKTMEENRDMESLKDSIKPGSAFQPVATSRQQLLKQIASLQQENKEKRRANSNESLSSRLALAEMQSRVASLETENGKLKEAAEESTRSAQQSLDLMTSLRKQISELGRKGFYLESEKKQLMEKLKSVQGAAQGNVKLKDRLATEQIRKLQEENQLLLERVRSLESGLTKKMMSADLKIVQTVKENDKLRQKLAKIYSAVEAEKTRQTGLVGFVSSLKQQHSVLMQLQESLKEVKLSVLQLESSQPSDLSLRQLTSPPLTQVDSKSGRSIKFVRNVSTSSNVATVRTESPVAMATKGEQLKERSDEINKALHDQQEVIHSLETKLATVTCSFSELLERAEQTLATSNELTEQICGLKEFELSADQLKSVRVLEQKLESLQDQVIDRESALQDIEVQMKKDYSEQDKKFASLKLQLIKLLEQLSTKDNFLRTKDQYIQQLEEKQVVYETQLYQAHKEIERQKRDLMSHSVQGGQANMAEIVRVQGEEIHQLQKMVSDFSYEVTQLQTQLDAGLREKSKLQSKILEMERMHLHVKETVGAEIDYLRKLNLQFVDQKMRAEKATEILKEVKEAQEAIKQQRDTAKLEAELEASKLSLHEQSCKISELEGRLANQNISLKLLQAEKDHAFLLTQHVKDLSNQIPRSGTGYLRPHSAESRSSQMPIHWKLSGKEKMMTGPPGRSVPLQVGPGEFSIPFPIGQGVDILDLEVPTEPRQSHFQLGPTVVTDDEFTQGDSDVTKTKSLRPIKSRFRGHRRTASTGSDVIPPFKETAGNIGHIGGSGPYPSSAVGKVKGMSQWYPRRPGSAGSTRQLFENKAIEERTEVGMAKKTEQLHSPIRGRTTSLGGVPLGQSTLLKQKFPEIVHPKLANKSTDSNETTTSSESKGSSAEEGVVRKLPTEGGSQGEEQAVDVSTIEIKHPQAPDLVRHESCSSSSSIYRSLLPSRTPSFYDGSESSPYESVEIGDSVENLQLLSFGGHFPGPYLLPIFHKHEPTSSSDDDYGPTHTTRRKKSSGVNADGSHDSRGHKNASNNSNSSCESDHSNKATNQRDGIPVHRNESISISDMENCTTDVDQNERKIADLRKNFGRKRFSSTGSVKICYSESSNTSLEDISRN